MHRAKVANRIAAWSVQGFGDASAYAGRSKSRGRHFDRFEDQLKEDTMLSETQMKAFNEFYSTARDNRTLDEKTTFLVHLAASMAVGCYPCMKHYVSQADDLGITKEEIGAVLSIVMAVSSGRVMMQFNEASGQEPSPPH
jgi:alkylhydroperoxidase/carboxymuconolactone decarboxylase family protein YurZ